MSSPVGDRVPVTPPLAGDADPLDRAPNTPPVRTFYEWKENGWVKYEFLAKRWVRVPVTPTAELPRDRSRSPVRNIYLQ